MSMVMAAQMRELTAKIEVLIREIAELRLRIARLEEANGRRKAN